jgi:hypothetical protein
MSVFFAMDSFILHRESMDKEIKRDDFGERADFYK